jgi:putative oxidoreductase
MAWMQGMPSGLLTFIGTAEILGGLGLVLPALTNIAPMLTPLAGVGLAIIMVLAMIFHIRRSEWQGVMVNLVLGGLATFIAYGRFVLVPLS